MGGSLCLHETSRIPASGVSSARLSVCLSILTSVLRAVRKKVGCKERVEWSRTCEECWLGRGWSGAMRNDSETGSLWEWESIKEGIWEWIKECAYPSEGESKWRGTANRLENREWACNCCNRVLCPLGKPPQLLNLYICSYMMIYAAPQWFYPHIHWLIAGPSYGAIIGNKHSHECLFCWIVACVKGP